MSNQQNVECAKTITVINCRVVSTSTFGRTVTLLKKCALEECFVTSMVEDSNWLPFVVN